ncbi:hypothetical protein ACFX13_045108 [Malus domestica]
MINLGHKALESFQSLHCISRLRDLTAFAQLTSYHSLGWSVLKLRSEEAACEVVRKQHRLKEAVKLEVNFNLHMMMIMDFRAIDAAVLVAAWSCRETAMVQFR